MKKKRKLFLATLFIVAMLAISLFYNVNTSNAGDTPTKKCQYKYTYKPYKDKSCPYDALPGSNFCIWHEEKNEKNFKGKKIKDTVLVEAYLIGADLRDAVFMHSTNLRYANLEGADLRGVHLEGADLRGANLEGADLRGTYLRWEYLTTLPPEERCCHCGIGFEMITANFGWANLTGADFRDVDLREVRFQGADLTYANLQGADLSLADLEDAHLRGANLQGADLCCTNFQGAYLSGANLKGADLSDTNFQGAYLSGTNLREADLCCTINFQGADLSGVDLEELDLHSANLKGADLSYSNLQGADLFLTDLQRADLSGANLEGADLRGANLEGADLRGVHLEGADLSGANLKGADLSGVDLEELDLHSANLKGADLSGANLKGADLFLTDLQGADLSGANIEGADLSYSNLQGADLSGANIEGADLSYSNLQGADLFLTDLQRADLSGANLEELDLCSANLQGADLSGANLKNTYLTGADLEGMDLSAAHLEGADLTYANLKGADLSYSNLQGADLSGADLRESLLFSTYLKDTSGLQYAIVGDKYIEEIVSDNAAKFLTTLNKGHANINITAKRVLSPILIKEGLNSENLASLFSGSITCSDISRIGNPGHIFQPIIDIILPFCEEDPVSATKYRLTLYKHSRDVYIELKNYFKDAGYYVKSGQFFISEYRVRGKIYELTGKEYAAALSGEINQFFKRLFHKGGSAREPVPVPQGERNVFVLLKRMLGNYFAFFVNKLLFATSEYGESVSRVLFTAIVIIFIYAGIYSIKGSAVESNAKPEARKLIHDFWTNLYFSIVTFTTLGYGDLRPIPSTGIRLLAGSEAFLGAFTIAYFVVVVSRKIMR